MATIKPNVIMMPKGYPSTLEEVRTATRRGWILTQGHWVPPSNITQADITKILHAQQRRKVGEVPDLQTSDSGHKGKTQNSADSSHREVAGTGRSRKARNGDTRTA